MRKAGRVQFSDDYWKDSDMVMSEVSYTQRMRQDKLTARDLMKAEMLDIKERQDETKARLGEEAKERQAEEKREFEDWKAERDKAGEKE